MLTTLLAAALAVSPRFAELSDFHAPVEPAREHVRGFLWVEAESLADYGAWRLDTQYTHKMGSAYLIAPGVLKPIGSAKGTVDLPRAGAWRVWARTKDWLPEHHPGQWRLSIDGKSGRTLGASGRDGWCWELGGVYQLEAGRHAVALKDLSGAFARCDALLFTTDEKYVPPAGLAETEGERARLTGVVPEEIVDGGAYDVVVVGAGTGGIGAAVSAARTGARTLLVHDRPVPGGNSSVELGIGTDGAAGSHPNRKLNARETGLCEEANLRIGTAKRRNLTSAHQAMIGNTAGLTERTNERVLSVEKDGDRIAAVISRNTLTGRRTRVRGKIFIDATGDGWVGVFAGAEKMFGREASREFNEAPAPEKRDDLTMSGCLLGGALSYRYQVLDGEVPYETPAWARVLPKGFDRNASIRSIAPTWWIEHGGRFDDCEDPERARDELIRISFAYWGWVKNESKIKDTDEARRAVLNWVPYMNGRREGYRLVGDYILTANDCLEGRIFPDRITYGGWPLDTHDPLGIDNPTGNGYWRSHPGVPEYTIPFRCLYSKNVPNLMMAGRCISVTHIALGSTRVEATIYTLGQAAGTGAALALRRGLMPREYGASHITELQQRLLKDDQFIPGLKNEDPADLARDAKVRATSTAQELACKAFSKALRQYDAQHHVMDHDRAVRFSRQALDRLEAVTLRMRIAAGEVERLRKDPMVLHLYETDDATVTPERAAFLGDWKSDGAVKADAEDVRFSGKPVKLSRKFVWLVLDRRTGVEWFLRTKSLEAQAARAYGIGSRWTLAEGAQYDFIPEPMMKMRIDTRPDYVTDGVSRPRGDCTHGWISDPSAKLPQSLALAFAEPVPVNEVRLTFDTDLTPTRVALYPKTLVKAYRIEGRVEGRWVKLVEERCNTLRLKVHRFPERTVEALRITVMETYGDPSARINEVRVYCNEGAVDIPYELVCFSGAARVEDGCVRIDSSAEPAEFAWRGYVMTATDDVLQPNTRYVATFRAKVEGFGKEPYLYTLVRPKHCAGAEKDVGTLPVFPTHGKWQSCKLSFMTASESDYRLQFHSHNRIKAEIADLKIEALPPLKFVPIAPGAKKAARPEGLPEGAEEFDVDLPRTSGGPVLNAADYGVSPASADNTAALRKAFAEARKCGASKLVLAPGRYKVPGDSPLVLEGFKDFTFDGKGAVFICRRSSGAFMNLSGCVRTRLMDFALDWDWAADPLASVVEVKAIGEGTVDLLFKEYADFPNKSTTFVILSPFDPVTRSVGVEGLGTVGVGPLWGKRAAFDGTWIAPNLARVRMLLGGLKVGALYRLQHYYYHMNGFVMYGNEHLRFEGVRVLSTPGHAFVMSGPQHHTLFDHVNIVAPKGDPRRVITCTADHLHVGQSRGFIKLQDCEFSLGADDIFNMHDVSGFARASGRRTIRTQNARSYGGLGKGARIELRHGDYSPTGFIGTVEEERPVDAAQGCYDITFAEDIPDQTTDGFVMFNRAFDTHNIIVRGCNFHDNRARGLLILARDVTVEDNVFCHQEMGAIKIETGYTFDAWSEGYGVSNVVIRGNRFIDQNPSGSNALHRERTIYAGIYLKSDPSSDVTDYPIIRDLLFEDNVFENSCGVVAYITSSKDVTFLNNVITDTKGRRRELPYRAQFYFSNTDGIELLGNRYNPSPCVAAPGAVYDPASCKRVKIQR